MDYVTWAGLVVMLIVAVVGGWFALSGQKTQAKTQAQVAEIQSRSQESRLALDLAIETRDRLDLMEEWESSLLTWWEEEHRPRDELRDKLLRQTHPDLFDSLPKLHPMPRPGRKRPVG